MINLDNLEELISESVYKSIQETFGQHLSHEKFVQDVTSDEIEDKKLRAPKQPRGEESDEEMEEQEQETEKTDVKVDFEKKSEPNKATVKQVDVLPQKLDVADIAKTLNVIRSGKSLKDPEVYERFKQYYGSLSGPEKIALKSFLDGLAQVIAGNVEGTAAAEPGKPPYNVKMEAEPLQKDSPKSTPDIKKKNITKISTDVASGTTAPIVVGESADKSELLKFLKENK